MGWASGGELFEAVLHMLGEFVPKKDKPHVYKTLVKLFEGQDCDTLGESVGIDPLMDRVLRERGHAQEEE